MFIISDLKPYLNNVFGNEIGFESLYGLISSASGCFSLLTVIFSSINTENLALQISGLSHFYNKKIIQIMSLTNNFHQFDIQLFYLLN